MKKKQRIITGVGLAAGLVAGGGAGLLLESTGSAGASTPPTTSAPDPTAPAAPVTPATGSAPTPSSTPAPTKVDRSARLKQMLQSLVDDGTLTQAQFDAVIAKLDVAGPGDGGGGPGFGGRGGERGGLVRIGLDTVATTLGVTVDELRTALEGGITITAYAVTKGKTAQDVIDALVTKAKSELDARVTAGDMTQAEADTKLAAATTMITDVVTNGGPLGGMGGIGGGRADHPAGTGGRHGDFPGRDGTTGRTPAAPSATAPAPAAPSAPAPATPAPATTVPSTPAPATTTPGTAPATTGS